jgi:cell division protein FtsL
LRVVRSRKRRRPIGFIVLSILVVGLMVFGLAATNVLLAQGAFALKDLALQQAQLEQDNGLLRLEMAELRMPSRIASSARKLGLELPTSIEVVHKQGLPHMQTASTIDYSAPRESGGPG